MHYLIEDFNINILLNNLSVSIFVLEESKSTHL